MAKKQICKGDAFPMMAQSCYACLITCLETKKMNYLTKWSKLVATLSFCMTISGCATLFTPKKTLTVHSYPEGAAVYGIRNNSEWQGQTDYLGTTPFKKKVSAAVKYLAFTKDGYETSFIKTKRKFNPVVLADIIYPLAFAFDVAKWNTFKQTSTQRRLQRCQRLLLLLLCQVHLHIFPMLRQHLRSYMSLHMCLVRLVWFSHPQKCQKRISLRNTIVQCLSRIGH